MLVADDEDGFRSELAAVLGRDPGIAVVGETADGVETVDVAVALAPDVVVMGARLPGTGVDAARRIRAVLPAVKVLVLSSSEDDADLFAAVRAGASGYLLKDDTVLRDAADAVWALHRGRGLVAPELIAKLFAEFALMSRRLAEPYGLTPREVEVLRLVARGLSNKEIAAELVIAEYTAKNHVRAILRKLQLRSRTEAALYAVREKLADQP